MNMLNYFVEANAALLLSAAGYWLLLRKEDNFKIKRIYLVVALFISGVAPLIPSITPLKVIPSLSASVPAYWLPEFTLTADGADTPANLVPSTSTWTIVSYMYVLGVIFSLAFFVFRIGTILRLWWSGSRMMWQGYPVIQSVHLHSTFSFAGLIFLAKDHSFENEETQLMLRHEASHLQRGHSYDIVFTHLLGVIFWFNPIIRWYRIQLHQQHEFEADALAVAPPEANAYCQLLAQKALQQAGFQIAHHFNNSFTLKRIAMLQKVRSRLAVWKVPALAFSLLTIIVFVSCQDQLADLKVATDNSTVALLWPEEVQDKLDALKQLQPEATFSVHELNEEGKKTLDKLDTKSITQMHIITVGQNSKDAGRNFVILQQGGMAEQISSLSGNDQEVFTVVEESASPKEGIENFYRYLGSSMRYPVEARRAGIQGKVFIEFIVNKDGSLSDFRVARGIGNSCDEEALRVMRGASAWNPGKQKGQAVRQKMVIPINFQLDDSREKLTVGQSDTPALSELVVIGYGANQNESFQIDITKGTAANGCSLTGMVKNKTGQPMAGVNIMIGGTTTGTVTDMDGKFKLNSATNQGTLIASFVGFQMQTITY
jgi:TonB family protein